MRGHPEPAESSSCFCTHPRKRIGRNGVSSSVAPSARQINCRKLPTKSKSAIVVTLSSHCRQYILKERWCDLSRSRDKLLSRCLLLSPCMKWQNMAVIARLGESRRRRWTFIYQAAAILKQTANP